MTRTSGLRAVAWTGCLAVACVGLAMLARSEDFDRPMVVLLSSDVVLGLVLYAGPGALDPRLFAVRLKGIVGTGLLAVVVQAVVGCALFPLTHDGEDPDYSWFGVIPFITLLGGLLAGLLAVMAWVFLVAPILVIATRSPAALRGDLAARQSVLYSVLVLTVLLFATAMSFADPSDGRAGIFRLLGLLVGLIGSAPGQGWLIWGARALVLVVVGGVLLLRRTRHAITAAGGDPDEGVPVELR